MTVCAGTLRLENGVDAVRDDPNALRRHARELDRLGPGELRDGDDRVRCAQHAREAGTAVEPVPARKRLGCAENREVVHREHGGHLCAAWAAEGRAVEDVERASAAPQPSRVPQSVTCDARDTARAAEGEQLELEARPITKCAQEAANVAGRPGARLDQRGRVDSDAHHGATAASAQRLAGCFVHHQLDRFIEAAPAVDVVLGVQRRLPAGRGVRDERMDGHGLDAWARIARGLRAGRRAAST